MTLREAIRILSDGGVESAAHDARELFSAICGMSRAELVSPDAESDSCSGNPDAESGADTESDTDTCSGYADPDADD